MLRTGNSIQLIVASYMLLVDLEKVRDNDCDVQCFTFIIYIHRF
jgi:hypothetical protein